MDGYRHRQKRKDARERGLYRGQPLAITRMDRNGHVLKQRRVIRGQLVSGQSGQGHVGDHRITLLRLPIVDRGDTGLTFRMAAVEDH